MVNAAKFWDRWAERYSNQPIKDPKAYQSKLEHTQAYFKPDMNVLEFGCGTGSTAIVHSPFVKHIKAIDISDNMIAIAKQKANTQSISNIDFEVSTLDSLTPETQMFDVILGLSILHLLEDWQSVLTKAHSLLKPGGIFVSSTPCIKHMTLLKLLAPLGQFAGLIPQLSYFSKEELISSLIATGFEIEYDWQPKQNTGVFIIARKVA
ncbi:class I SAM-dependent DNA methyltransferase [Aliiglaciecola sp. M165]|uniref:class I SAM-dependent DNA methyltransferase n=1 Tax=Aliiglaciecola sp. M165 TaxID=2593649 RepID=UPI0011815452|nr:class I SAM-dependent methyltransferase [Aliiglaciecola sp. M165]TRY33315.1 methyltransferase domain-containing protein [Aliiglaciecola sp. M165]